MITSWIFALLLANSALAADPNLPLVPDPEIKTVDGKKEVWVNLSDGSKKFGDLEVIPKGSKLFHWADPVNSARWAAQGHVDDGEVKALEGGQGAIGGGFYASTDFWDSRSFGPKLTVFTTTQDVTTVTYPEVGVVDDWDSFNEKLRPLGIDGVGRYANNKTWFNFLDAKPLLNARAAIWQDFEESALSKTNADLSLILRLNPSIQLQETDWVKSKFPLISQILHKTLDLSKMDQDSKTTITNWLIGASSIQDQSPLTKNIRELFKPEALATLKSSYDEAEAPTPNEPRTAISEWLQTTAIIDTNMTASRKLGIPYASWLPRVDQPELIFPMIQLADQPVSSQIIFPTLPYSKTINQHLAYLNIDDFLSAVAQGKPIDKIYDSPGLDPYLTRWNAATRLGMFNPNGALGFHQAITGNTSADFRDGPAGSDGDILWQGKKYFQVGDQQIQALKKSPFITPEFQTITDPARPGKTIQVARYDYPTAADFEKFSDFLSDSTKQTLTAAKNSGTLTDLTTPAARALTKQMLSELANYNLKAAGGSFNPVDMKLFFLSIHPFNEANAETAAAINFGFNYNTKAFFSGNRTIPGKPDEALLMTRESFHASALEDLANAIAIQNAFIRAETESPKFPRYFDVPEIWQVGRKVADIGPDPAAFVQQSKAIYAANPIASCVMKTVDAAVNQGVKK